MERQGEDVLDIQAKGETMRIALASDHAGFELKEIIRAHLKDHEVVDFGSYDPSPVDYPRTALKAARAIADGTCEMGILVCGSGIGMSIAANKVKGVRAALCVNTEVRRVIPSAQRRQRAVSSRPVHGFPPCPAGGRPRLGHRLRGRAPPRPGPMLDE